MTIDQIAALDVHFILCMERTGSSMLTMMLNRNNNVLSPSEEPFALYFYREYSQKIKWTEEDVNEFIIHFERVAEKNLTLYYSPLEVLKSKMLENRTNLDFDTLIRLIYSLFLPLLKKEDFTHVVDKQIKYTLYTEVLEKLFPSAKFIVLVRDPRAVVASWKKRGLGLNNRIAYMAKLWAINYGALIEKLNNNRENYMLVKYEDLITNNEVTLRQICKFLHLDFQEEMLSHHELPSPDPASLEILKTLPEEFVTKIKEFHHNTLNPINESLINEWQKNLSSKETDLISTITYKVAAEYGYSFKKSNSKISLSDRFSILFALWEKKVYLKLYVLSPLWLKSFVKKYRPNVRKE